jgi:hypothetical protein
MTLLCLLLLVSLSFTSAVHFQSPHFPKHFTADVSIVSHLVTPDIQTDGYPPAIRNMKVSYDRELGSARVDEGIISYLRRFDLKKEYKINSGPYPSCRKSYLGEEMPQQQFSRGGYWLNNNDDSCPKPYDQQKCKTWYQDEGGGQIAKVYVSRDTYIPYVAKLYSTNPVNMKLEPTLTFQWKNIDLNKPNKELFVDIDTTRADCEDQAGGFPWIHLFHHFFRI